jgi:hypothetical protein
MRAAIRSLLGFCLFVAAACAGVPPPAPVGAQPVPLEIRAQPLVLKLDEPALRRVGKLVWRGGVSMTANSPNFGGWSDLHVAPGGKALSSISDEGSWLTATIDYDSDGNLSGLSNGRIGSLRGLDGKPLDSKVLSDAEGLARLPDGSWMVSFEHQHRFWRYATLDGTPTPIDGPADLGRQPGNGGVEAITALADGRIVAISEDYVVNPGMLRGWIGTPSGSSYGWQTFDYTKTPDFNPTALRQLPDGSFVLLERAFDRVRGVRVRVMQFDAADLRPGGAVRARELARLVPPYAVDNLEGLAAGTGPRGETLLWLMSDDNFNPMQRNILMMFEVEK